MDGKKSKRVIGGGNRKTSAGEGERSRKMPRFEDDLDFGHTLIVRDFGGEGGEQLKQSFIQSIQECPTDLDLICSEGGTISGVSVHRYILMGVSKFLRDLLRDQDIKDTKAVTLAGVNCHHLLLAVKLIYTGSAAISNTGDKNGVLEVLKLLGITAMKVTCGNAAEEYVDVSNSLGESSDAQENHQQEPEVLTVETEENMGENENNVSNVVVDNHRSESTNEGQAQALNTILPSLNEAMEIGEENDLEIDNVTSDNFLGRLVVEIGKNVSEEMEVPWRFMETLPSLTSLDLRNERLRVFSMDVTNKNFKEGVKNLFLSLPHDSLEKRLGMMAIQCDNFDKIFTTAIEKRVASPSWELRSLHYFKKVGESDQILECSWQYQYGNRDDSKFKHIETSVKELFQESFDFSAYENFMNRYYPLELEENELLEFSPINGLEHRVNHAIKCYNMKSIFTDITFKEKLFESLDLENGGSMTVGGIGWERCWPDEVNLSLSCTRVLFPTLPNDRLLASRAISAEYGLQNGGLSLVRPRPTLIGLPNLLLENGMSCFPVVQKPGMLIYNHVTDHSKAYDTPIPVVRMNFGSSAKLRYI